jgi:hypothetical protein
LSEHLCRSGSVTKKSCEIHEVASLVLASQCKMKIMYQFIMLLVRRCALSLGHCCKISLQKVILKGLSDYPRKIAPPPYGKGNCLSILTYEAMIAFHNYVVFVCACVARPVGSVHLSVCLLPQKSPDLEIWHLSNL